MDSEALEMIKILHPELLFLDIMMPKINGFEVCRELKQSSESKHIYIIMLMAKGEEINEEIAF